MILICLRRNRKLETTEVARKIEKSTRNESEICLKESRGSDLIVIYLSCKSNLLVVSYVPQAPFEMMSSEYTQNQSNSAAAAVRKTKIVCTIGPCTSTREMIWKLAEEGMDVARLNMSHGDHSSHKKTIDLVKEYNAQCDDKVIAIMLDTKVNLL